jgi:predicted transposase
VSVRTIALTLKPTTGEQIALEQLQRRWGAACNYISQVAWEQREFNRVRLQWLVYQDVRARFGLLAQHVIRAIAVVTDSYKADESRQHTFRQDAAVVLDTPRLSRIAHNRASLATLDGRLQVQLGIGGHQRHQLATASKLAEADLVRDEKGRWRLLVSAHYSDPPQSGPGDVLGVDLGIKRLATAPASVPITVPRPPARLAPPIITAAKVGKVMLLMPAFGEVELMKEKSRMPPTAAHSPLMAKTQNL